jgi:uncharacterized protein
MQQLRFLPERIDFFAYFRGAAANGAVAARLLNDLLAGQEEPESARQRLRDLEHQGDAITHDVFAALSRNLIAPLSYEDIRALTRELDDFIDDIDAAGQRLILYQLLPAPEPALRLASIIREQAELLTAAVPLLEQGKHRDELERHVAELHRLEHEADDELNRVLASLYEGVTEIPAFVHAMRWGELYGLLEDTTDRAEKVANSMQGIMEQRL